MIENKSYNERIEKLKLPKLFKEKLLESVISLISNKDFLEINYIYLFGSCARGDFRSTSDLDILIITSGKSKGISFKLEGLDIRDEMSYPNVDVIVRTEEEISSKSYLINKLIKQDRVLLWEKGDTNGI